MYVRNSSTSVATHSSIKKNKKKHEIEDLKMQLLTLRRTNIRYKNENDGLKVKMRRMEEKIKSRNKVIENLFSPQYKHKLTKEIVMESGTVTTLQEENTDLKKMLLEKEVSIIKLQRELDSMKAYIPKPKGVTKCNQTEKSESSVLLRSKSVQSTRAHHRKKVAGFSRKKNRSQSEEGTKIIVPFSDKNKRILATKDDYRVSDSLNVPSFIDDSESPTSSNLENLDIQEIPHEEIEQLQTCFKDIIDEVNSIKNSISSIKKEKEITANATEKMDSNRKQPTEDLTLHKKSITIPKLTAFQEMDIYKPIRNPVSRFNWELSDKECNTSDEISDSRPASSKKGLATQRRNGTTKQNKIISKTNILQSKDMLAINVNTKDGRVKYEEDELEEQIQTIISEFQSNV